MGQSSVREGAKDTRLDVFLSRGAFSFLQSKLSGGCSGAQTLRDNVPYPLSLRSRTSRRQGWEPFVKDWDLLKNQFNLEIKNTGEQKVLGLRCRLEG